MKIVLVTASLDTQFAKKNLNLQFFLIWIFFPSKD